MRWQTASGPAPTSEPAVVDDNVYVSTFGDAVEALDVRTGNRMWSVRISAAPGRAEAVDGTLVLGSAGDRGLRGITLDGRPKWSVDNRDVGGSRYFTSVAFGAVAVTTNEGQLTALSPRDGSTVWNVTGGGTGQSRSDPTVQGAFAYTCLDSTLHVVDRRGRLRSRVAFEYPQVDTHHPVVRGDRVYVATAKGVTALDVMV
ncbi:outer membrane protein assembly factor BamB family protein [Streptomyces sp. NPDC001984]|uniref:outer membrane protein assembly factor BamB family protein n=1 Tax=Streptomyces sp. NPDC002619 TaxID=3364655 RepID=UPI0036C428EE